ncbi:MAG: S8 family serine peptidase [Caldilineales bacterium]|nr:S8 family serine peptidase [Caldilineales bacterium]
MTSSPSSPSSAGVFCYGGVEVVNRVQLPFMPTPDRASPVTADYYRAGGAALNVAIALAAWGVHATLAGNLLGEDAYADLIESELERHPLIDTRWLARHEEVRTPFTRIFVLPDRERYAMRYGHAETRWLPLTGAMLAGTHFFSVEIASGEAAVAAATLARTHGRTVFTTDVIPEHPLIPLSDYLITSATYLRRAQIDDHLPDLAAEVQARGGGVLIVTNGSDPIQVFDPRQGLRTFPSFSLPPVDRTGAGDIFKAGCLFGWAQQWELEQTLRFAAAAAALWIAQPTPLKQAPLLPQIEALLAERAPRVVVAAVELSAEERACPLCQQIVPAPLFEKHWDMEDGVIQALRRAYPGWRRADGACPQCVHQHRAIADRLHQPAMPLLVEGHPIYGKSDLFVLPTAVRLRANPHYTGRGVTLCFLDSGFYPHPDLIQPHNRIVEMVDATTDAILTAADFREPRPVSWHGMMTSVAAAGNGALSNGLYAGIASEARVVLVKISDARGRVRERDITRGLRWLLENHRRYAIDVVNISVGGDRSGLNRNSIIDGLVRRLVEEGVVVVAASGNAGQSDLYPPASAPEAITVGGIDDRNVLDPAHRRMYGSNWGRMAGGGLKPEVTAPSIWLAAPVLPGTHIAEQNLLLDRLWQAEDEELPALLASTYQILKAPASLLNHSLREQRLWIRDKLVANKFVTPYYQHVDGTSFAAPIVSSVAAQMLEANRSLSVAAVKGLIVATAAPLPHEPVERQGHGVITPGRAVAAALRLRHGALGDAPLSPHFDGDAVHFIYYDDRAAQVAVVGDFNGWNGAALPLHADHPGRWQAAMPSPPPGRYHYKFLIDGDRWVDDPENADKEPDGYGGFNAVLEVDDRR